MKYLILACGLLLIPFSAAHAKPADCFVEVRGHTLLSGLCEFTAIPGGHFRVSSYEDNGYAPETFVNVIITQKDVARGFWNGSRYQPEAEAPLGTLIRSKRVFALPVSAQATGFQSPSGNIHCFLDADYGPYARCDITYVDRPPRTPAYCDLDYGQAFGVDERSRGEALCVGDTAKDDRNPVLNYGSSISQGGITCRSEETGMSCENERGHGFSLSRKTQRVY